jgi:hypothetical protein
MYLGKIVRTLYVLGYKVRTCVYGYILTQIQLKLHFLSGTITLATLTSLLLTLV